MGREQRSTARPGSADGAIRSARLAMGVHCRLDRLKGGKRRAGPVSGPPSGSAVKLHGGRANVTEKERA